MNKDKKTKDISRMIDENININLIKTLVWFRVLLFECTILSKIMGGNPLQYIPMLTKRDYINRDEIVGMFTFKGIPESRMKLTDIFALSSMGVDKYVRMRLDDFDREHIKSPTLKSFLNDVRKNTEYIEDLFFSGDNLELFDYMVQSLNDWDNLSVEVTGEGETAENSKDVRG